MAGPQRIMFVMLFGFAWIAFSSAQAAAPDFPSTETRIKVGRVVAERDILGTVYDLPYWRSASYHEITSQTRAFRTPNLGTTYTLASLARIAGNFLQTTTTGFMLRDRVIVSPRDGLLLVNETLLVGDEYYDETIERKITPRLVVRGRLRAENFRMKSAYHDTLWSTSGVEEWRGSGWGLLLTGQGGHGRSEATLTSCSFQAVVGGLVLYSGSRAAIGRSAFRDCGAICVTSASQAALGDCVFKENKLVTWNAQTALSQSSFLGCGAYFMAAAPGSFIWDCALDGLKDNGYGAHWGVVSDTNTDLQIIRNQIRRFDTGVFCISSNDRIEDNTIEDSWLEGLVFGWGASSRLRRNVIRNSATYTLTLTDERRTSAAGVLVYGGAQPYLGTAADPGLNLFINNGPFTIYHAGPTTATVHAQGNAWGPAMAGPAVEALIYHQPDDAADADQSGFRSGPVLYLPLIDPRTGVRPSSWIRYP